MSSEVERDLARFGADADYFDKHRAELVSRYPDNWVAIYFKEVAGAASELGDLIAHLKDKGVPPGRAYVGYATDDDLILIVPVCFE